MRVSVSGTRFTHTVMFIRLPRTRYRKTPTAAKHTVATAPPANA